MPSTGFFPAPRALASDLGSNTSRYAIALYILFRAVVSIIAAALLPDHTGRDISQEYHTPY
jgi:hypothetical protein